MQTYWKEHPALRCAIMAVLFAAALALIIIGWKMTGMMKGLIIMIIGVAVFLAALAIYNSPYSTPKKKKSR